MALYTILSKADVLEILSKYGMTNVLSFHELDGGSQNSNYRFSTNNGDYVISIYEKKSKEEVQTLAQLLGHLQIHNFPTSVVIRTIDGNTLSDWKGKPVMIKNYIEGIVMENLSPTGVGMVGKELAKLHLVTPPDNIRQCMSFGIDFFQEVNNYASESSFAQWLLEKARFIRPHIRESLPKALIHSDLFSSNVIIKDIDVPVIMDFEEAAHYYRIFDVSMAFIGICRQGNSLDFEKAKSLLQGYLSEIELTEEEIQSLQVFTIYAATSMSFWRHRNFHYTVPTPSLFDHYLELKHIADNLHEMGRFNFLKSLNFEYK